ncbi:MaoC/PaaZ C-terminal domain-containing protein [Arthrobacter sp. NPDC090010]|uniref:MaoC/PaaZ C-terminal domain-containing protein n=1 Tax=Arthrobacter sp. NPDC090010 TaxID=3363942 RepID=UPI00382D001F
MNGRQTVVLQAAPALPRLYLNAAASAARQRVRKRPGAQTLPDVVHELPALSVDLEHLTAFQRLMHATVRDELPSAYLHTLAFPVAMSVMTREDFPLPLLGLVHLENHVEHHEAVPFSMPLTVRAHAEALAGHRTGTTVDMVAEVSSADTGALLWHGRSRYLAKGVFFPGVDKPSAVAEREPFTQPTPTGRWRLGVETGREYAGVSGDFNPIHLSSLSAKALGMKTSLAHGMYSVARVLAESGHDGDAGVSWQVFFEAPVYLPSSVAVRITDRQDEEGSWGGTSFQAWNEKSARRHFHGTIEPLRD